MQLIDYLNEHNLSVNQFAYLAKLSVPVIYRVLKNANIAPKSAKRIRAITNGDVDYKKIMVFNSEFEAKEAKDGCG
jgi:hypothetical protein